MCRIDRSLLYEFDGKVFASEVKRFQLKNVSNLPYGLL